MSRPSDTDPVVVFSAHLDDGVLSASVQLAEPDTRLVTVFAGHPPAELALTPWGRATGATSMQRRHADRLEEDRRAATILGCRAVHLDEPEQEYRGTPVVPATLAARAAASMRSAREVWAPAAIGGHRDHRLVREAVLAAWAGDHGGRSLYLYADLPYALDEGWPSGSAGADLDGTSRWLSDDLADGGADVRVHDPIVRALTEDQRSRKAEAVGAYASQLAALGLGPSDMERWGRLLAHEVAWRVTTDA